MRGMRDKLRPKSDWTRSIIRRTHVKMHKKRENDQRAVCSAFRAFDPVEWC